MVLLSILVFAVSAFGLGYASLSIVTESTDSFERNVMRLGLGLGLFVFIGVVLNLFRVPLDWKIFLGLSVIAPCVYIFRNYKKFKKPDLEFKVKKDGIYNIAILALFLVSLFMYVSGAFAYPYLENADPWGHAEGVKYVASEKTVFDAPNYNIGYLDPYPPAYDMVLGVLHQTNDSVSTTLKFFNALFLSLSILFFYFFAKEFTGNRKLALFSTAILASLPSFFTHFIWAHSLVIMFFFVAMYALEKTRKNKRWMYPAMVAISAVLLTQPSQAVKLGLMFFIYVGVRLAYERKAAKRMLFAGVGGLILSMFWWAANASDMIAGRITKAASSAGISEAEANAGNIFGKAALLLTDYFKPGSGTATRVYTFSDFVFAQSFGGINVHVGWGIAVSALLIAGLIFFAIYFRKMSKDEKQWTLISVLWFVFTFLGVNAMTFNLPIGFITFRFWLLLAIPVALLSSLGLMLVLKFAGKEKGPRVLATVLILLAVLVTASYPKFVQNTTPNWPPGHFWTSAEDLQTYMWLENLPGDARVFEPSERGGAFVIGFDRFSCGWCDDDVEFKSRLTSVSPTELRDWLVEHDYQYMIIAQSTIVRLVDEHGEEELNGFLTDLTAAIEAGGLFDITYQNTGGVIIQVA